MHLEKEPAIHPTAQVEACRLGEYVAIGKKSRVAQTVMGDYSYCADENHIAGARIGRFTAIASHVRINPGWTTEGKEGEGEQKPVHIGSDVQIGCDATIMGGVTIGDGAVIQPLAVVTRDVAPYEVVAGTPARHLKFRFPPETIRKIEKSGWWKWSRDQLFHRLADLEDVETFCEKYGG